MRSQTITMLEERKRQLLRELGLDGAQAMPTGSGLDSGPMDVVQACSNLHREIALLEGIARGEAAITDGRVVTHADARARLARWLH